MAESLERFGPFLLARRIGRGGMGEVYLARCPWPDVPLGVVKRLHAEGSELPKAEARFEHEADLALRLDHPRVVTTLDVGEVEGRTYVASELVLGKDIGWIADRLLERHLGAPLSVALAVLIDVLDAFAYIHSATADDGQPLHLVHRDVKPGNILVGYDGITKLADFGLAKSRLTLELQLTGPHQLLGTPTYLAPEMLAGETLSPAADVYGLGAVLYRLLSGAPLYTGSVAEIIHQVALRDPRPIGELRPDLPEWLQILLVRLLARDPAQRPTDSVRLKAMVEHRARQDGLLVPPAATGRWLQTLFATEFAQEQAEVEQLAKEPALLFEGEDAQTSPSARPRAHTPVRPGSSATFSLAPELSQALMQSVAPRSLSDEHSSPGATVVEDLSAAAPTQRLSPVSRRALELALDGDDEATVQAGGAARVPEPKLIDPVVGGATRAPPISSNPAAPTWSPPSLGSSSGSGQEAVLVRPAGPASSSWLRLSLIGLAGAILAFVLLSWPIGRAPAPSAVALRYQQAKATLVARKSAGLAVPPEAWELSANAASALLEQDQPAAEAAVTALEQLLAAPVE